MPDYRGGHLKSYSLDKKGIYKCARLNWTNKPWDNSSFNPMTEPARHFGW